MHFEILVEDQSGKVMLDLLVPKLISTDNTFTVHAYKGIGRIPKNLQPSGDPQKRILLSQLPRLLAGYGKVFASYSSDYTAAVIVVCDLDDRDLKTFKAELESILKSARPRPKTAFCFAIEEGEAWFFGDIRAIQKAYPKAKAAVLSTYVCDSICGTWELLAEAIYSGDLQAFLTGGHQAIGREKSLWAQKIVPHMNVSTNKSPSFLYFRKTINSFISPRAAV